MSDEQNTIAQPACKDCRFWVPDPSSNAGSPYVEFPGYPGADENGYVDAGECHRRAPSCVSGQVMEEDSWPDNAEAVWPITLPLDWCGEWEGKEAPHA